VVGIEHFWRCHNLIADGQLKFIDLPEQLSQHPLEMFIKPAKLMIAAALKRGAWHFLLLRRDF
jgi:hypothetical protein